MDKLVLVVPATIGLVMPMLALRGIYGLWGWWGIAAALAVMVVGLVLHHLMVQRGRAMCPAYQHEE